MLMLLCAGCGFQGVGADLAGADLAGIDLAGVDFSGVDLTNSVQPNDLSTSAQTGPGPLGALPSGFCCTGNSDCASRLCGTESGVSFCTDLCDTDAVCMAYGGAFICDPGNGACLPSNPTNPICVPANQYVYGSKPIGSCCSHGFPKAGQECLGGKCVQTGANSNPFYCTQGCDSHSPCPGGYSCMGGFCWIAQTVGDPNYVIQCQ
jgi:hypothetical protein